MADETIQHPEDPDEEDVVADPADSAPETQENSPEASESEDSDAQQVDEASELQETSHEDNQSDDSDAQEDGAPAPPTQRRREVRDFEVSGDVTIDGKAFPLRDWSSSGFGIVSCDLEFEDHARVDIDFNVTHSAGTLSFSCKAIIVRSDTVSCEVAGAFVEMGREDRVAVTAYFDALDEA